MKLSRKSEELLTPAASDRGSGDRLTRTEDEEIIISQADRSTYPERKSVRRTEATPEPKTQGSEEVHRNYAASCERGSLTLQDRYGRNDCFTINAAPRSTEGVIYYLGEITRCTAALDATSECSPAPAVATSDHDGEDAVFRLVAVEAPKGEQPAASPTRITIAWGAKEYAVTTDPSAADRSGQVLRILSQLIALNRSAKDFPAPTVIPLISH